MPADEVRGELTDGFNLVVDALKLNGVQTIYGVVGIPITDLARVAQDANAPKGNPCAALVALARLCAIPRCPAHSTPLRASVVLPTPAGPVITAPRLAATAAVSRENSLLRPTIRHPATPERNPGQAVTSTDPSPARAPVTCTSAPAYRLLQPRPTASGSRSSSSPPRYVVSPVSRSSSPPRAADLKRSAERLGREAASSARSCAFPTAVARSSVKSATRSAASEGNGPASATWHRWRRCLAHS